jgi:hypothetical protein
MIFTTILTGMIVIGVLLGLVTVGVLIASDDEDEL